MHSLSTIFARRRLEATRLRLSAGTALGVLALSLLPSAASAQACQVTVNTDAGAGSLRACVATANGSATIDEVRSVLPAATNIDLTSAEIAVTSNILLDGANPFTVTSGPALSQIFTLSGGSTFTIGENVTLLNQNFAEAVRILDNGNTLIFRGDSTGDGTGIYVNGADNRVVVAGRMEVDGGNTVIRGTRDRNRFEISGDLVATNGGYGLVTDGVDTVIDVSGTITATGNNSRGIFATGTNQRITISGDIETSGNSAPGVIMQNTQAFAGSTLTLSGSILTTGDNSEALQLGQEDNVVNIRAGATVETQGVNALGVNSFMINSTVNIAGSITTSGTGAQGLVFQDAFARGGNTINIARTGSVVTTNDSAAGLVMASGNNTINVDGLIETGGSGSEGILIIGTRNTINVRSAGRIETTGSASHAIRLEGNDNSVFIAGAVTTGGSFSNGVHSFHGGNLIDVSGSIMVAAGNSAAIHSQAGNDRINVSGEIDVALGSTGIYTNAGSNRIDVSGSIAADTFGIAIETLGGNNVIDLSGSVVTTGIQAFGIIARGGNDEISVSGKIETDGQQAFAIILDGSDSIANVSGQIATAGQDAWGVYSVGNNNEIKVSSRISTTGADADAIVLQGNFSTAHITGRVTTTGASADAISSPGQVNKIIISGTVSATGAGSNAVAFTNGGTLELRPGYSITGNAFGSGSGGLWLGGAGADTFDVGLIGTQYSGFAGFSKAGTSIWTLTGATTESWVLEDGTLLVEGAIGGVDAPGGILGGTGRASFVVLDGGALAPGVGGVGTFNVTSNLFFAGGMASGRYLVDVGDGADLTNVGASASLAGGAAEITYLPTGTIGTQYTILTAAGGLGGTEFASVTDNAPGVVSTLTYDANNVYLNVDLAMSALPGLSQNEASVGAALDAYFDRTGTIPGAFALLDAAGLNLLTGEVATAAMGAGFQSASSFTNLLADPDLPLASGGVGEPIAYAMTGKADRVVAKTGPLSSRTALAAIGGEEISASGNANAALLSMSAAHGADSIDAAFTRRWTVWGAAYGGSERIGGDPAVGSADTRARVWGVASGITRAFDGGRVGIALGGGGSTVSLANGLGGGRATNFHAGVNGQAMFGDAYLSGALAYGLHDTRTSRVVPGDVLTGNFTAHTLSGRVEAGYGFAYGATRFVPYAAAEATGYLLPSYVETSAAGGPFALARAAQSELSARTELGARVSHVIGGVTLSGRAAWAWNAANARTVTGSFQSLPGAAFTVNGAAPARHALLLDAGLEAAIAPSVTAKLTFNGEVSRNVTSYGAAAKFSVRW